MTKIKMDDGLEFETFYLIEKFYDHPEKLTPKERKRLKELGLITDQNGK